MNTETADQILSLLADINETKAMIKRNREVLANLRKALLKTCEKAETE